VVFQHRVMLQRNLLYTGVTRAKRLVMLVGSKGALQVAVQNAEGLHRYSWLSERIKASL
jgi:exodeoxyribonuclease V alpha subunit